MPKLIMEDGTEYILEEQGVGCTEYPSAIVNGKSYIGRVAVENPAKDYEILSSVGKDGGIHDYSKSGCERDECSILSVKRITDGEAFTIGDEVKYSNTPNPFTIEFFEVSEAGNMMAGNSSSRYSICYIEKVNNVLFTTEDGVKMYHKDHCWELHEDFSWVDVCFDSGIRKKERCKYFYYSTNRSEYILMNKPCLSVNDIKELADLVPYEEQWIINLAKEKINATT